MGEQYQRSYSSGVIDGSDRERKRVFGLGERADQAGGDIAPADPKAAARFRGARQSASSSCPPVETMPVTMSCALDRRRGFRVVWPERMPARRARLAPTTASAAHPQTSDLRLATRDSSRKRRWRKCLRRWGRAHHGGTRCQSRSYAAGAVARCDASVAEARVHGQHRGRARSR